tara:strand:+ start:7700 stop:7819 length:120 start_codon:yes stop_codon:yes gene_type:complete
MGVYARQDVYDARIVGFSMFQVVSVRAVPDAHGFDAVVL